MTMASKEEEEEELCQTCGATGQSTTGADLDGRCGHGVFHIGSVPVTPGLGGFLVGAVRPGARGLGD